MAIFKRNSYKPISGVNNKSDYWDTDPSVLEFRRVFKEKYGEEPSRDPLQSKYDYDAAFKAGVRPVLDETDGLYHWDSQFKADDHQNRFVDGIDTKRGNSIYNFPTNESSMEGFIPGRIAKKQNIQVGPEITTTVNPDGSTSKSLVKPKTIVPVEPSNQPPFVKQDVTPKHEFTMPDATKPQVPKDGLNMVQTTNIISGINTLANVGANIVGAISASKMRPTLVGYRAPVEAKHIDDNTEQAKAAAQESIDRSIKGATDVNRRFGRTVSGDVISKGIAASNEMSGKLADYRKSIQAQNVQMDNSMAQYNDQAERGRDSQNAQTQNAFDIQKSGIISGAMTGISGAITGGTQSIVNNLSFGNTMQHANFKNNISALEDELSRFSVKDENYYKKTDELNKIRNDYSLFLKKTYGTK